MRQILGDVDSKEIAGFPAYRITADGNLWSRWKHGQHLLTHDFRLMRFKVKEREYRSRYRRVVLIDENGKRHSRHIHKLMLETFVGPCPDGMQACHNNGDSFDNRLENLRWDTPSKNQRDRLKHGTGCEGEDHYLTKLTNEIVLQIRREHKEGLSSRKLALKYGVVHGTISFITQGKTWKHILEGKDDIQIHEG